MEKLVLSPSRVKRWVRCRKSYYWRYYQKLVKVEKESPPTLGLVVGLALADYYREPNRDQETLDHSLKDSISHHAHIFLGNEPPKAKVTDWGKIVNTSTKLLSTYHEWASPKDDFEVIFVEQPREVDLTNNLSLLAIPDAVVRREDFNLILEHKVRYRYRTGDFGIDYQSAGSCLVSGSIGTMYNVLEYSKLKPHRDIIIRSDYELDYFRQVYISIGEDILSTPPEKLYPMPMGRCYCEYWELCNAEMTGLDLESVTQELYVPSVRPVPEYKKEEGGEDGS